MFFDIVLLNRQHRAHLAYAWIAGTRGIRHVSKKQIAETDLAKISEEIGHYVASQSDSPRSRFSLRLSIILINGTVKIYRQKAVYLMEDVMKIFTSVSRPKDIMLTASLSDTGIFATPPTPIVTKKGKKRPADTEKSTPQSEIDRLVAAAAIEGIEAIATGQEQAVLQARADEITLHEIQPIRHVQEDFGALGIGNADEDILREMEELDAERPAALQPLPVIAEVPEPVFEVPVVPRQKPSFGLQSTSSSEEGGPVTITVEAQVHATANMETPPEVRRTEQPISVTTGTATAPVLKEAEQIQIVQEPERAEKAVEEPTRRRAVLGQLQVDAVRERDEELAPRRKRDDKSLSKLFISNKKPKRVVRINRCESEEVEWMDISPCPLPTFKLKTPNLTNLLNTYLVRDDDHVQRRQKTSDVPSLEASVTLQRESGVSEQIPSIRVSGFAEEHNVVETPQIPIESGLEIEQQLMEATPISQGGMNLEARTIEEVMAIAAHRNMLDTPRTGLRIIDLEPQFSKELDFLTLPSDLTSRELTSEAAMLQQEKSGSVSLPLSSGQQRHQNIVNKIFDNGKMTLEQICEPPVNRANIARAFSDVLVLCKHKYVELISEDDSCKLAFIDKGPKMIALN